MVFKKILKKNKYIYKLNALLKEKKMEKDFEKLARYYSKRVSQRGIQYTEDRAVELFQSLLISRGLKNKKFTKGSIQIFLAGTQEEQDYSGMVQALAKFGEITHLIDSNGNYGQKRPRVINSKCLLEQVEKAVNNGGVDIIIGQMLGLIVDVNVLKKIRSMGIIIINISMDDRLPELWIPQKGEIHGAAGLVDGVDLVLTTSPECCIRYYSHGCPALYFPLASDPNIFKPMKPKDIDVCFVGSNYGVRGEIINKLMEKGINVQSYGPGWPNGPVPASEVASLFGRSKIILGIGTVGYSRKIVTLKLRDFDATMAGALYITNHNPDLERIFREGEEIEYYSSIDEVVSKILYYLNNPSLIDKIGNAAEMKAREMHTWEKRFDNAFQSVRILA